MLRINYITSTGLLVHYCCSRKVLLRPTSNISNL